MVVQKRKERTIRAPMGHAVQVVHLSQEDIERELAALEKKHGMTSEEFVVKWNRGELDCGVDEYFEWAGLCHSAYDYGRTELRIVDEGVDQSRHGPTWSAASGSKIEVRGDILSTGVRWNADAEP